MRTTLGPMLLILAMIIPSGCGQQQSRMEPGKTRAASPPPRTSSPPPRTAQRPPAPPARPVAMNQPAQPGPLGGSDSSTATVMLPAADGGGTVYLQKAAPKQVLVGKEFDYQIRLTNMSGSALENVTLTGKLPADFRVASTRPKASITGRDATWDVGKLDAGAAKLFVVRGAATKTGTLYGCSDVTFRLSSACVSVEAVEPALKIVQTAPPAVLICEPIPIKVTVTNTGSGPASNVVLRETLPEGLTTEDGKTEMAYDLKTIPAGQSRDVTIQTRATKTGTFTAKGVATAAGDLTASDDSRTVVRQPVLAITQSAPKSRFLGLTVTQTVTVTNRGDGVAKGTRLVTKLPARCEFVRASDGGQPQAGQVAWDLGDLRPDQSRKLTFVVKPSALGTIESFSSVSAQCAKASAKAATEIQGIPAILLECIDEADPVQVGSNETYVITVLNQGSAVDTNIVITCTLPPQQQFVSADGPTRGTAEGQTVTFAPLKSLAPKATATYKVVAKATGAGDVRFAISLTSDQLDRPVKETESTNQYAD